MPYSNGDNSTVKIHWKHFKIFILSTACRIIAVHKCVCSQVSDGVYGLLLLVEKFAMRESSWFSLFEGDRYIV